MTAEPAIRSVVVAGGGLVGLSAAIAFARALPDTTVSLVVTAAHPAALADLVPTTWPSIKRFHAVIGIDELELVRAGIATHHVGTIFDGWSANGAQWVHAFGCYGKPANGIPFDQIWSRARSGGEALAFDRYSVGAALARAGKFVHPARHPESLGSRFEYGLRIDPELYQERLKQHAIAVGVVVHESDIAAIRTDDQGIEGLRLVDGQNVEADMFVDCTGPPARLISQLDDGLEDWSGWMPFDRLVLDRDPVDGVPATADRVRATDEGWSVEWPLAGSTVRAALSIGGHGIAINRGRRVRPWVRNVLAIGDSATALDPLYGMNLDVAHQGILLALELLPRRDFTTVETGEYNRRTELQTRRVRDFIALHYLRAGRRSGIWASFSGREPPDSLAVSLDQYSYRGRLPFHEEESVTRDSWAAALLGMCVLPAHVDPQAAGIPLDQAVPAMRQLTREIDETVARLPSYAEYLGEMMR